MKEDFESGLGEMMHISNTKTEHVHTCELMDHFNRTNYQY